MRTGAHERGGHRYTAIRSRFPCLLPAISSMTADRVRRAEIARSTRKAVQAAGYTADSWSRLSALIPCGMSPQMLRLVSRYLRLACFALAAAVDWSWAA